ncbi:MAG: hypothetical protein ACLRI8_04330 [Agathobacter rectalis]
MDKMMRQYADCVEEYAEKICETPEQALGRSWLCVSFDLRTWSLNPA